MNKLTIPFPLVGLNYVANRILQAIAIRGNELGLKSQELPADILCPRSYKWVEKEEVYGEPKISFKAWGGGCGFYVRGVLQGSHDSSCGTAWEYAELVIQFRPYFPHLPFGRREIRLDTAAIEVVVIHPEPEAANVALDAALAHLVASAEAAKAVEAV